MYVYMYIERIYSRQIVLLGLTNKQDAMESAPVW